MQTMLLQLAPQTGIFLLCTDLFRLHLWAWSKHFSSKLSTGRTAQNRKLGHSPRLLCSIDKRAPLPYPYSTVPRCTKASFLSMKTHNSNCSYLSCWGSLYLPLLLLSRHPGWCQRISSSLCVPKKLPSSFDHRWRYCPSWCYSDRKVASHRSNPIQNHERWDWSQWGKFISIWGVNFWPFWMFYHREWHCCRVIWHFERLPSFGLWSWTPFPCLLFWQDFFAVFLILMNLPS